MTPQEALFADLRERIAEREHAIVEDFNIVQATKLTAAMNRLLDLYNKLPFSASAATTDERQQ